jgi:hypothetical protein
VATTVHVPKHLLERVDVRAKVLGVSRNRVIVEALEMSLGTNEEWSPELLRMLERPLGPRAAKDLESTMKVVRARRTRRRRAPAL